MGEQEKRYTIYAVTEFFALVFIFALLMSLRQSSAAETDEKTLFGYEIPAKEQSSCGVSMFGGASVRNAVTVTKQPENKTVAVGNTATFKVTAAGTGTIKYQWQCKAPGSSEWLPSSQAGAKTNTLSVATNINHNGYRYRCMISDNSNTVTYSEAAVLTIIPKITKQPVSASALVGAKAAFSVEAVGKNTIKYQWQCKAPGNTVWINSTQSGAGTSKLSVTVNTNHNGYQYRCVVTDGNGKKTCSAEVMLYVVRITTQPAGNSVQVGKTAAFFVTATGKPAMKYQWQAKAPGASEWTNSKQEGATTSKLFVATSVCHNGYQYRCVVTDETGKKVYSEAAKLTIMSKITAQPANQIVKAGTKAVFSVAATGKATMKYQWQCKAPNATDWTNSSQSGSKTAKLTVATTSSHNGYLYRCVVTDGNGRKIYSDAAKLTIENSMINATDVTLYGLSDNYREAISIPSGYAQTFQLKANGTNVSYHIVNGGGCCSVDSTGLVKVRYYQCEDPDTGALINYSTVGTAEIECIVDGKTYIVTVHVENYAVTYADEKIREYLNANIKEGMTDEQVMNVLTRYPASFAYKSENTSYVSLIVLGGGSCLAGADMVVRECEMLGIEAWIRNAGKDALAASPAHVNAMVCYKGAYYVIDATPELGTGIWWRCRSLFSEFFPGDDTEVGVYHYDNYEYDDTFVFPDIIDGRRVTTIGDGFFTWFEGTEIALPACCENIMEFAFAKAQKLKRIVLPATLKSIGDGAFAGAMNLQLEIDEANPYLTVKDNCIYSKDMTVLYSAPSVSGKLLLPDTLKEIRPYAFFYNTNVTEIVIPAGVTTIGEFAFGLCTNLKKLTFRGNKLSYIDSCVFIKTGLETVTLPSSVKCLHPNAFLQSDYITYNDCNRVLLLYPCNNLNVVFTSAKAPVWEGTVLPEYGETTFFAPMDSEGYDVGVWKKLNVHIGGSPTVSITLQPESSTVEVGDTAIFKVTATGKGTLKYQWQYKAPGDSTWFSSSRTGAKTNTLSVATNVNHNGYQYRCMITDSNGERCSDEVVLTIKPKITEHPADVSVAPGSTAVFTVKANGKATLKYQWQAKAPGSSEWKNSTQSGSKTAKLSVSTNANHNGYQYRCVVTDGNGKKVYSDEAKLLLRQTILSVTINEKNFPDAAFRSYVTGNCDTNKDGKLSNEEITAVTTMDLFGFYNITSLKGIEHFVALTELECSMNRLTSLNLNANKSLERLDCSCNELTSLNVSGCSALSYLNCGTNQLTSLNLNPALKELVCSGNIMTSLDLSAYKALEYVTCYNCKLTSLNVSGCTKMKGLECSLNNLTSLNISANSALEKLFCTDNRITVLDVTANPRLWQIHCDSTVTVNGGEKVLYIQYK